MATDYEYACTRCSRNVGRHNLTVKKAIFVEMGEGGRTLRSRVTGWLCDLCLKEDAQYSLPKFRNLQKESI